MILKPTVALSYSFRLIPFHVAFSVHNVNNRIITHSCVRYGCEIFVKYSSVCFVNSLPLSSCNSWHIPKTFYAIDDLNAVVKTAQTKSFSSASPKKFPNPKKVTELPLPYEIFL